MVTSRPEAPSNAQKLKFSHYRRSKKYCSPPTAKTKRYYSTPPTGKNEKVLSTTPAPKTKDIGTKPRGVDLPPTHAINPLTPFGDKPFGGQFL